MGQLGGTIMSSAVRGAAVGYKLTSQAAAAVFNDVNTTKEVASRLHAHAKAASSRLHSGTRTAAKHLTAAAGLSSDDAKEVIMLLEHRRASLALPQQLPTFPSGGSRRHVCVPVRDVHADEHTRVYSLYVAATCSSAHPHCL